MNNFVFPLMKIIDEYKNTQFYDLPWALTPVIPVSLEGVLDINSLLTVDEGREEIGKAPLTDKKAGAKMISQGKTTGTANSKKDKKEEEVEI